MSSNLVYKRYSRMTEGEIRQELFDMIGAAIGQENMHLVPTSEIKTLMKAYANAATERVNRQLVEIKNTQNDRMKGDGRIGTGDDIEYPQCPKCGEVVFGQAYTGATIKEMTLYCANDSCEGYKVRFVDLKRKV